MRYTSRHACFAPVVKRLAGLPPPSYTVSMPNLPFPTSLSKAEEAMLGEVLPHLGVLAVLPGPARTHLHAAMSLWMPPLELHMRRMR